MSGAQSVVTAARRRIATLLRIGMEPNGLVWATRGALRRYTSVLRRRQWAWPLDPYRNVAAIRYTAESNIWPLWQ